jgi:delta(3,5)-delta(2,4)-dienoyl-CoA isomerase
MIVNATESLSNSGLDPARQAFKLRQHILDFQGAISSLAHARQPVICALHGLALGLAVDIASACDIRLAASNSIFGIMVRLSPLLRDVEGEADV